MMSDLLQRYEAFAAKSTAPTPIEDRWALDDRLRAGTRTTAARGHVLRDGICSCKVVARFNEHQLRDPHSGKWIRTGGELGALIPDDSSLFDLTKDSDRYEASYEVHDEAPSVKGLTAISMTSGETQVAYDDGDHRYVLADSDPDGMRDFAGTIDSMVDSWNEFEGDADPKPGELIDYQTWDDAIQVGYDIAGDFRFSGVDSDGKAFSLPELTPEDAAEFADHLRDQADAAEELEDTTESTRSLATAHEHVLEDGICVTCSDAEPMSEEEHALLVALDELGEQEAVRAAWDPAKHPRNPDGKFRSLVDRLKDSIEAHAKGDGAGHPFNDYSREQLRRVAKARGIELKRGESRESIAEKLLGHVGKSAPKAGPPKVRTWEELGKPQGPSPVGEVIGYMGGTYERLPGEPRKYRVISADGRDISDRMPKIPGRNNTAEDARTALRMDAYERERVESDTNSAWRKTLNAITGSWSYDTGEIEGFDKATPAQRVEIRDALKRWTADKAHAGGTSRMAEPSVNSALRGATPHTPTTTADVAALDLALGMSKTKRAVTVYRGATNGEHILPADWETRDLTGLEWSNVGFTPASADPDAAEAYVGAKEDRGFGIRLKLPKGSPAIAIPDAIGGDDNEGEIVLPRDLKFRVTKDNGATGDYGNRWLDVEVVKT